MIPMLLMVSQPFRITWRGEAVSINKDNHSWPQVTEEGSKGIPACRAEWKDKEHGALCCCQKSPPSIRPVEVIAPKEPGIAQKGGRKEPGSAVHYTLCQEQRDTERTTSGVPWTLAQPTSTTSQQNTQKRPHLEETRTPAHLSAGVECFTQLRVGGTSSGHGQASQKEFSLVKEVTKDNRTKWCIWNWYPGLQHSQLFGQSY